MFLLHGLIRMTNILIQWSSDTNQAYKYYVINIDTENMLVQSVYRCTQEIVIRLKKKSNFLKWKSLLKPDKIFLKSYHQYHQSCMYDIKWYIENMELTLNFNQTPKLSKNYAILCTFKLLN